jgi:hypothetical protein
MQDCLVEWSDCITPAQQKEPSKQGRFVRSATVGGAPYRGNVYFHGFTFEGQDYRIGDAVLMHTSDDPDDAWLAELHKAWEERLPKNSKTPHLNRRLISVKWFYTRDDIKTHERTTGIPLDSSSLLLLSTVAGKDRGKGAEVLHSEHIQKELEIDCIEGLKSALVDEYASTTFPQYVFVTLWPGTRTLEFLLSPTQDISCVVMISIIAPTEYLKGHLR